MHYPIALEGALKLKEISYIHAEGYPAGEMKHGPIALIDEQHAGRGASRPTTTCSRRWSATSRKSRRAEARSSAITTEGDDADGADARSRAGRRSWRCRATTPLLTPIVMTIPLQLLAYHIAVRRGCDVDQPRNLAKSVTVE